MVDDVLKKHVNSIIHSEIGIDPLLIDAEKPIRTQVSLDSMQFIGLVARIEIELGMELPIAIMQVSSLREFYDELFKSTAGRAMERN